MPQIFVHVRRKLLTIEVEPTDTVRDVKAKIQDQEGTPPEHQQLISSRSCGGFVLKDDQPMRAYWEYVTAKDGLRLRLYLRGVGMQILIKTLSGKTIPIDVSPYDTIDDVKATVMSKEGIPPDCQRLIYMGAAGVCELRNGDRLNTSSCASPSILEVCTFGGTLSFVKMTGKTIILKLEYSTTIKDMKTQILCKEGILVNRQRLIYAGRQLEDSHTVGYYNLLKESTIHLQLVEPISAMTMQHSSGHLFTLHGHPGTTIEEVKAKIHKRQGIPPHQQELLFAGKQLVDGHTLSDYGVHEQSSLPLLVIHRFHILIVTSTGKRINLDVVSSDTIKEVKVKIADKEDIPSEQQSLHFNGHKLLDLFTLHEYKVQEDTTLDLHVIGLDQYREIAVRMPIGRTIILEARANDKVESVKAKVHEKGAILPSQQHLIASELHRMELEDDNTLDYYDIRDGSTVYLLPASSHTSAADSEGMEEEVKDLRDQVEKLQRSNRNLNSERKNLIGLIGELRGEVSAMKSQQEQLQRKEGLEEEQATELQGESVARREQFQQEIERLHCEMELQQQRVSQDLERQVALMQQELAKQQQQQQVLLQEKAREAEQRVATVEEQLHTTQAARLSSIRDEQESWLLCKDDIELTTKELGRGGWGSVRVGKFRGLQVAAKCLYDVIISDYNRRLFAREMSIAARLRHPNLVLFLGAILDGEPTIVMEKLSTSLRAVLEQMPLNPPQITSICLDVARALNYLHQMQPDPIIHRDISSANVLLNPGPNHTWMAKVSDYGSANVVRQLATANPGSPAYAAPEAEFPSRQSPKMDVYSYGVLLLEICTRRFPDPDKRDTLVSTVNHPQVAPLIPQCLQQDPQGRPTMDTIVNEFDLMQ